MLEHVEKLISHKAPNPELAILGVPCDDLSVQLIEFNEIGPFQDEVSEQLLANRRPVYFGKLLDLDLFKSFVDFSTGSYWRAILPNRKASALHVGAFRVVIDADDENRVVEGIVEN